MSLQSKYARSIRRELKHHPILNRGYPQAVMARIRQLAERFAELLDRWQLHPPEEQEFDTEGWRVFQQYKLLFR